MSATLIELQPATLRGIARSGTDESRLLDRNLEFFHRRWSSSHLWVSKQKSTKLKMVDLEPRIYYVISDQKTIKNF
jgi:predicted component of type VI protein secretion system